MSENTLRFYYKEQPAPVRKIIAVYCQNNKYKYICW